LARDAALDLQRDEQGNEGWVSERLKTIMQGFKAIDDWQDAIVLQRRVTGEHKLDVLYVRPSARPADYESVRDSLNSLDEFSRQVGLERLVQESASNAYFDYAERLVLAIKDPRLQSDGYADLGSAFWKSGTKDKAAQSFNAAVEAASR